MPDKSDTLADQCLAHPEGSKRQRSRSRFSFAQYFQTTCHIMLETSLFAASSVLMALGLPLFFFLAISGWDLLGLFTHLDNLSARYIEATAVRRLSFSSDLKIMFFAATALIALLRMPGFITRIWGGFPERADP